MKRIIFLILISIIISANCLYSQDIDQIKGGFRSAEIYYYCYLDGEIDKNSKTLIMKVKSNEFGKITEKLIFDKDERIFSRRIIIYDSSQRILEDIYFDSKDTITDKWMYKYNQAGKLIEETRDTRPGVEGYKAVLSYDTKDRLIVKSFYKPSGLIKERKRYTYDTLGNLISEALYDSYELLLHKINHNYDNKGNEIGISGSFFSEGNTKYEYDASGHILEVISLNQTGEVAAQSSYRYDSFGNKIEERVYHSFASLSFPPRHNYKTTYSYDEFGNLTEEIIYDESGQPAVLREYIYSR